MVEEFKLYKIILGSNNHFKKGDILEVSNLGRVKVNGEIFEPIDYDKEGYKRICSKHLHRIVAELFIPNPENKPCIDHINTIRTDNSVENLRWVTRQENRNNPLTKENNRKAQIGKHCGELNPNYGKKLPEYRVEQIKKIHTGKVVTEETKQRMSIARKKYWENKKHEQQ